MHATHLPLRQDLAVRLVHKNTVRREHVRPENSKFVEILHGRCAIFLAAIVQFLLRLRHMNQDRSVVLPGERGGILQRFLRTGIHRVRRHRGMNQRVTLPALQEFFRVFEHRRVVLIVRGGKVEDGLAQYAAHAGGLRFLGDGVLKVIHVCKRGHASANLLRRCQSCAPAHKFFVHVLRFRRENEFRQPLFQRHVILQTPEQGHRHMRVAVDESRENQLAARIDLLFDDQSFRCKWKTCART